MSGVGERIRQWWYPPAFRIRGGSPETGLLLAELNAIHERLAALPGGRETGPGPDPPPPAGGLDKDFAVNLCNQVHRLQRSAAKAQQQGASEAERLQGHLARVKSSLEEKGFTFQDLTGQRYDPGREDFELLGEPQPAPGLRGPTILQCERPAVLYRGKVVQRAKGVVGTPAP